MLDQVYGKPSESWRRAQVLFVLLFWISRISRGNKNGPPVPFIRRWNNTLKRFTPWQLIVSTLTAIYAIRNGDALLGLTAPDPLARLYSRNYFRATWITTALDAGFATAMTIRWKWLRDIASLLFAAYYLFFAQEADDKLRKYRAVCTVEMLRTTWEKTSNPYIRFATQKDRPRVAIRRKILLPRPASSAYTKPIVAWLFYNESDEELSQQTELIFDMPGGGFICMSPEHHEERIRRWTIRTGRPVLSFDYGKAPEYPYPFAIDEMYDAYKLLHETRAKSIGMSGEVLDVVLTGDSAGANIATVMLIKILETKPRLPMPVSLVFAYAALSFHFTSWMPSSDLKVLRSESSANIQGLLRGKDHLDHRSPLSVVEDVARPRVRRRRTASWGKTLTRSLSTSPARFFHSNSTGERLNKARNSADGDEDGQEGDDEDDGFVANEDKTVSERVMYWDERHQQTQKQLQAEADKVGKKALAKAKQPLETKLAMTSRTAFFNDRIISPPMCRAMALLYIGPNNAPDMHSDYHISPIFTPASLLVQFPPVYLSCGERDPFVDDTVIFAGKLREAKEARKMELLAKENKFGESLRMSGSSFSRDPILDEHEDDWVDMRILGGWSHGYLQMIALLPEAEHAINMMADCITDSFERHQQKAAARQQKAPTSSTPARIGSPARPKSATASTPAAGPSSSHLKPGTTSESEKDDEVNVLSFTPRRRRPSPSQSRAESPLPGSLSPSSSITTSSSRRVMSPSSDEGSGSASTAATSRSLLRSPESRLSPPALPSFRSDSSSEFPTLTTAATMIDQSPSATSAKLLSPAEHALKDELSATLPSNENSNRSRGSTTSGDVGSSIPIVFSSDEEQLPRTTPGRDSTATVQSGHLLSPKISSTPKQGRSGSFGSSTPLGSHSPGPVLPTNLIDAKELLKRRRDDVVYGISASNSAVPSDDEAEASSSRAKGGSRNRA
ncbi:hypothetical protein OIO90_005891 [Microbotryomycetes sp. JL221]|nr:hypothetical protein OIO90_005891 [Microbotryomycetes sp. JL221]